ncbi:MAG: hypothetical protein DRJ37_02015 [Thermoprotei archaeon]|nr:MAG: hypothetical protein DRJ37_02015 [Thermoprotei archaeon]
MPLTKKLVIILLIVIVVLAGGVYYFMTLKPKPKEVELTLYTKAGLWADFIRNSGVIEEFEKRMYEEKGIIVKVKIVTAPHKGYREKVVTDFAAGTAGDVVWLGESEIPGLVEAGMLLDLTPYVEKWDAWDKFYEVGKKLGSYNGKVYAIPFETAPLVIYYRKDIFQKAGLPVPWQPKTWDDVVAAARAIKEKVPDVVPFRGFYDICLPIYMAGGQIYDPSDGKWIVKSDALLQAFKVYYDVFYTYGITPKEAELEKWDNRKLFQEGKLAILIDGVWCYIEKWGPGMTYEIPNREEVVGYAYIPGLGTPGAPEYISVTGTYNWVINAKTEHPDLAWELVKELCKPELIAKWGYETAHIVTRDDAVLGSYAEEPFLKWATTVLEHSIPKPVYSGYKKYTSTFKRVVIDYLVAEGKSPEECLEIFAEEAAKELGSEAVKEV